MKKLFRGWRHVMIYSLLAMLFTLSNSFAQTEPAKQDHPDGKNSPLHDSIVPAVDTLNGDPTVAANLEGSSKDFANSRMHSSGTNRKYRNEINTRAMRDFKDNFKDVDNETWTIINLGFSACFRQDHIGYWVYYDRRGNWLYTMRSYEEDKLPREVRTQVKSVYYDYSISIVKEIRSRSGMTYIIQVEDKKGFKNIRISEDGEMEVIQDLDRAELAAKGIR